MLKKQSMCKFFAAKLFDLMSWDTQYRYKIMGKPATCDGEFLFLFKLNDFELFVAGKRKGSYLPEQWRDYFGVPVEEHETEYIHHVMRLFVNVKQVRSEGVVHQHQAVLCLEVFYEVRLAQHAVLA